MPIKNSGLSISQGSGKLESTIVKLLTNGQKVVIQNRQSINIEPLMEKVRDSLFELSNRGEIDITQYRKCLSNLRTSEEVYALYEQFHSETVVVTMSVVAIFQEYRN